MYKVLVTGGAGFVGRHVTRKLLENGNEVHCVDNVAPMTGGIHPEDSWPLFNPLDYSRFYFYHEDCREYFKYVKDTDFDYVFHLAAMVGGRLMIENNPLAVADDLSIDAEYWQWAVKTKPKKTLCFSSSAAYPIKYQTSEYYTLLKEDMITFDGHIGMPDMTYGWAKLTCEYLALLAYKKHGLKSVVYRPFSGYGEDQDDTYPFPSICKRVLQHKGKAVITVWGSGRQMRDFIHIDDCVEGMFKTMDKVDDGGAVNLSTGIYTSFIDFVKKAVEICGYTAEVHGMSDKPEGVFARAGDTRKQKELGFIYSIDLKDGIERALEYYSKTA
ncbi:MAG: NAD-dependent epimerase/dehydratase family protein [Candidatus Omnitrophica bacterium]|nr:NAD-dependent epimerase/dehydratase family protein [Candidatus Omnitrophota bacterium]